MDEEDECSGNDNVNIAIAMQFAQITRESDVRFFTGFESTKSFKEIFNFLVPRARLMKYWEGPKRSSCVEREERTQQRLFCPLTNQDLSERLP